MLLGIDIGGTDIKYGIVDEDGTIIEKYSTPTKAHEGRDAVVRRIIAAANELAIRYLKLEQATSNAQLDIANDNAQLGIANDNAQTGVSKDKTQRGADALHSPFAVGIAVPGVVDPLSRHVLSPPNLPGWDNVPLGDLVRTAMYSSLNGEASGGQRQEQRVSAEGQGRSPTSGQEKEIRVVVENDANAAALAEFWLGAGRGYDNFLYVTLGTGIGGGVILNGQLYTGPHGEAGEIGHLVVDWRENSSAHARRFRTGVLEDVAGNAGIVRRFVDATGRIDVADVAAISKFAESGDADAVHILEETGLIVGLGICSAFAVLGIHHAVVGGGVSQSEIIINAIKKTVRERAIPTIARKASVERAHFINDAGLVGSAMLNRLSLPLHS